MKIGNFCFGQVRVSQGLHGSLQNNMAIDAYGSERPLEFRAVESGRIGGAFGIGTQGEGFHLYCDCGLDVIYVHCKYNGDKRVGRGDLITRSVWSHIHISARFNGIWNPIYCYTNEGEVVYTGEAPRFQVYPYASLPKYQNLDASTGLPINNKTMKITGKFKAKMNGAIWNIRDTTNSSGKIVGQTSPNQEFESLEIETYGQVVDNNSNWIRMGGGWVAMAGVVSCSSIGDDTQCQIQLASEVAKNQALTSQNESLNTQVNVLKLELNSFVLDTPKYIKNEPQKSF